MTENTLKCSRCGKRHPLSLMKYFQDAHHIMCVECIEKIRTPLNKNRSSDKQEKKKKRYKCQRCKHICQIKEGFRKQCSFCGSTELIIQEWNSDLDALIKDSSRKEYDR
jgi:DNA-directed RNA polymerase subunit RPC12/RpoP